jgi:hypothetical protein
MSRDNFIEVAASHLGYQARPGMNTVYGGTVGYQGLPWSGSFIDVVAREAGVSMPACVYSPSGLAEFINSRRWHAKPQPGDIVFFTWSTGETFGMPHLGIVTDVRDWQRLGKFTTIEAQVNSGLAKAQESNDGIYQRVRWRDDVLGFGRPDFKKRPGRELIKVDGQPEIKLIHVRPGIKPNRSIERVQLALASKVGLRNHLTGALDKRTIASYARWQRSIGFVGSDANGIPDIDSLRRLGKETGYFTVNG